MNRNLAFWLTISWCWFGSVSTAAAEDTLTKIERTGVLTVAIREDAPPFGYTSRNGRLQGYCLDFFALLESQLTKTLERNTLSLKLLKSTPSNRFSLVASNAIDLECGPNTIREDAPEGVSFSTGFFVTGTQFLVQQESELDLDSDLDGAILGAIANTTTSDYIKERYPNAIVRGYRGTTARNRGIQGVEQGRLDAMISDGILLRAAAQQQGLSSVEYPLVPAIPLTCDRYGMIIQAEDPEWRDFVNSVIDSPEAETLTRAWFGNLFSYIVPAQEFCQ